VLLPLSDTAAIGPLIATAFVATLWGVLSANVF
jgi:flagellar motor component MotA